MKTSAPSIKDLIKTHKPEQPIRPVVNWRNAPTYKLSKPFTRKVKKLNPLPHSFKIKNAQDVMKDLGNTPMLPHHNLASLDITNLYSNIPVKETKTILTKILKQTNCPQLQQELLRWFYIITKQNYFKHVNQILLQQDGVTMGAPSSDLIAEIFLQHVEHSYITNLTQKHGIMNYCRYVDDILIIFDPNHSGIQKILNDFNFLHSKLRLTAETEDDCTLNYLEISIRRTLTGLRTAIFRKPTFTDTIILFTSSHPIQHKYATVRYLYNRLESYNLQ